MSSRRPAQIFATSTGWVMKSSPVLRRWSVCRSQANVKARSTASGSTSRAASRLCSAITASRSPRSARSSAVSSWARAVTGAAGSCAPSLAPTRVWPFRSGGASAPFAPRRTAGLRAPRATPTGGPEPGVRFAEAGLAPRAASSSVVLTRLGIACPPRTARGRRRRSRAPRDSPSRIRRRRLRAVPDASQRTAPSSSSRRRRRAATSGERGWRPGPCRRSRTSSRPSALTSWGSSAAERRER